MGMCSSEATGCFVAKLVFFGEFLERTSIFSDKTTEFYGLFSFMLNVFTQR